MTTGTNGNGNIGEGNCGKGDGKAATNAPQEWRVEHFPYKHILGALDVSNPSSVGGRVERSVCV